jgi:hypothetical protein
MARVTVEVQIGSDGVRRVRVFGESWSERAEAEILLDRIKPFLDLIDRELHPDSFKTLQ